MRWRLSGGPPSTHSGSAGVENVGDSPRTGWLWPLACAGITGFAPGPAPNKGSTWAEQWGGVDSGGRTNCQSLIKGLHGRRDPEGGGETAVISAWLPGAQEGGLLLPQGADHPPVRMDMPLVPLRCPHPLHSSWLQRQPQTWGRGTGPFGGRSTPGGTTTPEACASASCSHEPGLEGVQRPAERGPGQPSAQLLLSGTRRPPSWEGRHWAQPPSLPPPTE